MNDFLFKKYFNDIKNYDQLTYEEEVALVNKAQNGDRKAFHKLVTSNQRFVVTQAKKFTNQGVELIDLISAGNLGLMKAIKRFEPNQGNKLISYAVWWIKQSLHSILASDARLIRMPLNKVGRTTKIVNELKKQKINTPQLLVVEKICQKYEIGEHELVGLLNLYFQGNKKFRNNIFDTDCELIGSNFLKEKLDSETKEILINKLDVLTEREKFIADKYFALFGDSWTLEMIGEELDLTRERVRQIKVDILEKMKRNVKKSDFSSKEFLLYPQKDSNRQRSSTNFNIVDHLIDYTSDDYSVVKEEDHNERNKKQNELNYEKELDEELLMNIYESL